MKWSKNERHNDLLVVVVDDNIDVYDITSKVKTSCKLNGITAIGEVNKSVTQNYLLLATGKSIIVKDIKELKTVATFDVEVSLTDSYGKCDVKLMFS